MCDDYDRSERETATYCKRLRYVVTYLRSLCQRTDKLDKFSHICPCMHLLHLHILSTIVSNLSSLIWYDVESTIQYLSNLVKNVIERIRCAVNFFFYSIAQLSDSQKRHVELTQQIKCQNSHWIEIDPLILYTYSAWMCANCIVCTQIN